MAAVWPSTVVEENNLNQNIGALRKALGESAGDNRFLVNEPGRGYRFVAPVRVPAEGAPKILNQPVSNVQIAGQPASFRVTAAGSGTLSYQWQSDGKDIPGATANGSLA